MQYAEVMVYLFLTGILLFVVALVVWARWVWRRHEEEAIYDTDSRSESHKKDPFFLSRFLEGLRGGPGGI